MRKKDTRQLGAIDLGEDPSYIQGLGNVEKQYTVSSDKLLAIREFGEDSSHKTKNDEDLCEHNDNNAITTGIPLKSKKKRKHSDGIQGSRYSYNLFDYLLIIKKVPIFFLKYLSHTPMIPFNFAGMLLINRYYCFVICILY